MIRMSLNRNSIMARLLLSMLVVLLIQTLLLAGNIRYGGTIEELNSSSIDLLNERVLSRKNYIQNDMIQRWSNLTKFEHDIQTTMNSFLLEKDITLSTFQQEPDLAFEFLERTVDDAIFAIRQRMVTGAFVVFGGSEKS